MTRRSSWLFAVAAISAPAVAGAQQRGTVVSGRVTDAATGQPVGSVQVTAVGTNVGVVTNEQGVYTLRGLPTRAVTLRVLRIGYVEQTRSVTPVEGQRVAADFSMRQAAVSLATVVTTATGQQLAREVGNAISKIDATQRTTEAPQRSVADMITAQAPGVSVTQNTFAGAGSRVRIRGTTSLSLSNDPIYVIDGVRMTSNIGSSSIGVGGTLPSRVSDINPEEIESIEIVKGPSAATLYGTDAANGVIVITTKRGRSGRTQLNAYTEQGLSQDRNNYANNYTLYGKKTGSTTPTTCVLNDVGTGACAVDSLMQFNPLKDPDTTPLTNGNLQTYGLNASGGNDLARYFISGEYQGERGPYTFPAFEQRRFAANNIAIRGNQLNPSRYVRNSFRANLNGQPASNIDLAVSTAFVNGDYRVPQTDNNLLGIFFNAGRGIGRRDTTAGGLNGYATYTPGDIFQQLTTQGINRFIGSTTANYRPTEWLSGRANVGLDLTDRVDQDQCRRGECPAFSTYRQGFVDDNRANIRNVTVDLASTASYNPLRWLGTKTTIGAQYINYKLDINYSGSTNLPPGTQTVTAGAVPSASEATTLTKTLGAYVQEEFGIRDNLFVTGAVRTDQNSAFGTKFQRVYYPKVSVAYMISDERFFHKPTFLDELKLRAAYGAAGNQPGPNDALQFFGPTSVSLSGVDNPAVLFNALGNPNLKPERATETEVGFNAAVFGNRANIDVTYYSKLTHDALIARIVPPTAGSGGTTRFENLGGVKNAGFEALVNMQLINAKSFAWDVTLNGSTNANKLVSLGGVPPQIGTTIRQVAGYPLNGYWGLGVASFNDADHNGILTKSEVQVDTAVHFIGYSLPRHQIALSNGFSFLNRQLRLAAQLDYNGGAYRYNNTERFRCQSSGPNCRGINDASAPLDEQARAIAISQYGSAYLGAYIEPSNFLRFRELSLTYTPTSLLGRSFAARRLSLTVAGRNLGIITNYSGVDPETDYASNGNAPADFFTSPPLRYVTFRVNLGL